MSSETGKRYAKLGCCANSDIEMKVTKINMVTKNLNLLVFVILMGFIINFIFKAVSIKKTFNNQYTYFNMYYSKKRNYLDLVNVKMASKNNLKQK